MAEQTQTEKLKIKIDTVMCAYGGDVREANCDGCVNFKKGKCENPKTKEILQALKEARLVFAEIGVQGKDLEGAYICQVEEIEI